MQVTIIGTGNMARGIGSRVLAGGHELTVVGRKAESAEAVAAELGGDVRTATEGDGLDADVVVLAVYYPDARGVVERHRDRLSGRTVVDISNPLNETFDGLVVPPERSAAQELAELAPDARFDDVIAAFRR